jgi:hypothetical protein
MDEQPDRTVDAPARRRPTGGKEKLPRHVVLCGETGSAGYRLGRPVLSLGAAPPLLAAQPLVWVVN